MLFVRVLLRVNAPRELSAAPVALHRMARRLHSFLLGSLRAASPQLPFARSLSMAPSIVGAPFRVALVQLGGTTAVKADNLARARAAIATAALGGGGAKPDLIVLPVRRSLAGIRG